MKNTAKIALQAFIIIFFIVFPVTNVDAERYLPWVMEKLVGKEAPEFTVKDLSGKNVSLSSFKGKPILLNFWATWCPYCRKERPYLNSLYHEYKDRGLVIITVSTDKSAKMVRRYVKKVPMDMVVLHDTNNKAAETYNIGSLPISFLIDRNWIIKHKSMGLRDWTKKGSKKLIEKHLFEE